MTAPQLPQPNHIYADFTPVTFTCFNGETETIYLPEKTNEVELPKTNFITELLKELL